MNASPLVAGGKLYVGTWDGTVWVLNAGREKRVVAKLDAGDVIDAPPVFANGLLYLLARGRLSAVSAPR